MMMARLCYDDGIFMITWRHHDGPPWQAIAIQWRAMAGEVSAMASRAGIDVDIARVGETEAFTATEAEKYCAGGNYTNVAMVHHETTAGVLNPIREVGEVVRKHLPNASFFVDSMSAFGAYDVDMKRDHVDYLVSSANIPPAYQLLLDAERR